MDVFQDYSHGLYIFTVLIALFAYFYCKYKIKYWKRRGVQQLSNTNLLFGNFIKGVLFRTGPGYYLGEIYREAPQDAPYVGFYIFHKPCLMLREPEIIKQFMIRDFNNFPNRHFAGSQQKDSFGMINLFGLKNPGWKYLRSKITPTLTRSKVKQMLPLMLDTGKPMMNYLADKCVETGVIDAQDVNERYASDLIANVGFGTITDSFTTNSDFYKCLTEFFHGFKRMVALVTVFFMPELVQIFGSKLLFDVSFVNKMFWDAVKSREEHGGQRGDYIDSILQLKNEEQNPVYKCEGENLLYQSGIFFSGFESSSTASAFTLMELAKNIKYQERARDDIRKAIEQHGWTVEAFKEMKYLDKCIAEGLRKHPPIAILDRSPLEDYKIPGTDIIVEKGTPIFVSLYGLNFDPQYFPEPEVYDPERFNEDKTISPAYMPFGIGPRNCVGSKLGDLHIKIVLSMILSEYEVSQQLDEVYKLDSRSTFTATADGIHIEFKKIIH